jgi:carbonic anhydrase
MNAKMVHGNVGDLLYEIFSAATEAGSQGAADPVAEAVRANVRNSVRLLQDSDSLQSMIRSGRVHVAGAIFNSDTGDVAWLDD